MGWTESGAIDIRDAHKTVSAAAFIVVNVNSLPF